MKSIIEGERALCFWLSQQTEVSLYHKDEKIRKDASDIVSLMTPVVKSLFTDMGMEITSEAMQIHGGYGFTKDLGIEQLYRDNRITPIYEGTNSVQAADLVFRKLVTKNGDIIDKYLNLINISKWRSNCLVNGFIFSSLILVSSLTKLKYLSIISPFLVTSFLKTKSAACTEFVPS